MAHPPGPARLFAPLSARFLRCAIVMLCLGLFIGRSAPTEAATCTISVAAMNLGVYTGAVSTNGATMVTVTCAVGTLYSIRMGLGNGSGATQTVHKVTGPSSRTLRYNMFRDSARTLNWGQTFLIDSVDAVGTGVAQTYLIYPRIPAGQSGPPGTYTDQVLISVFGLVGFLASTNLTVTASILPACTITSANLGFGPYSGIVTDTSAIITVRCTNGTPYNVGLSAGTAPGATVSARKMTGPASALLGYGIFRDAGRTSNWGNTVGTDTQPGSGNGSNQSLYIYGRIAAQQRVTPGAYADTIIATITY